MTIDRERLESFLADRMRLVSLTLYPLDVQSTFPVFRGEAVGLKPMFVKVMPWNVATRALDFLSSASDCEFLPRPVSNEVFDFEGKGVVCLEWKPSVRVDVENMSDGQFSSFLDGCRRLSKRMSAYSGDVQPPEDEDLPEVQYASLKNYARRHPVSGRLLRPLLSIPEAERTYGARKLVTIHSDLQQKNYGFTGETFSAVYDTEDLTQGLACEDAAYAFTERARHSELTAASRARLRELFMRLVERSPWPRDEWKIAVNHARLRIAARRLVRHPDAALIALDIARRDKPLRELYESISSPTPNPQPPTPNPQPPTLNPQPPNLKIFCVYFDRRPIWKSDCVEPIQAGRARTGLDLGMLADDTGDQISSENLRYGEMTAWYWVWKNYLPAHPELTRVGFSHYRRFLDFTGFCHGRTRRTTYRKFRRIFERSYNARELLAAVGDADLVMRGASECGFATLREQYLASHPQNIGDFDRFVTLLRERHPDRLAEIDATLAAGRLAMELQFVMKRELFADFMEWAFSLCREFERRWTWGGPAVGDKARAPAFLIERLFLVWLALRKAERGLTVKELPLVKLTGRPWWYPLMKPILPFLSEAANDRIYARFK